MTPPLPGLPPADEVLLDTATAATAVGVQPVTVRSWVHRGLLERAAGTARRPLYRASDLLRAQAAAKPRTRRRGPDA